MDIVIKGDNLMLVDIGNNYVIRDKWDINQFTSDSFKLPVILGTAVVRATDLFDWDEIKSVLFNDDMWLQNLIKKYRKSSNDETTLMNSMVSDFEDAISSGPIPTFERYVSGISEKDYSREERDELAKTGEALPDGSFPIKNKADLQRAINLAHFGRDPDKARKHIIKRAKDLDLIDLIPNNNKWR